ncbi:hypothetical protein L917_00931 [Phytophthora nicotianae]|uniref:Uncharacterized protein n=1 Tax=Phytophthora nicotianae TaxID=4792 RepID=W2M1E7_PHYNI|nr:hypothetical protein L917_00931 [Phytophthora nicotianae]
MTKLNLSDLEWKAAIDELLRINNNGTLPREHTQRLQQVWGATRPLLALSGSGTLPQLTQTSKEVNG